MPSNSPLVAVLMGSTSDWETMQHCSAQLSALGVAVLPLGASVATSAAESGDKVEENDSVAQQLGYRHDASKADGRGDGQFCKACSFFQGDAAADWGGCIVFGGRQVNAKGWCTSFRQRA